MCECVAAFDFLSQALFYILYTTIFVNSCEQLSMSVIKEMQSKIYTFLCLNYFHISLLFMTAFKLGDWEQLERILPSDIIRPHLVQISSLQNDAVKLL